MLLSHLQQPQALRSGEDGVALVRRLLRAGDAVEHLGAEIEVARQAVAVHAADFAAHQLAALALDVFKPALDPEIAEKAPDDIGLALLEHEAPVLSVQALAVKREHRERAAGERLRRIALGYCEAVEQLELGAVVLLAVAYPVPGSAAFHSNVQHLDAAHGEDAEVVVPLVEAEVVAEPVHAARGERLSARELRPHCGTGAAAHHLRRTARGGHYNVRGVDRAEQLARLRVKVADAAVLIVLGPHQPYGIAVFVRDVIHGARSGVGRGADGHGDGRVRAVDAPHLPHGALPGPEAQARKGRGENQNDRQQYEHGLAFCLFQENVHGLASIFQQPRLQRNEKARRFLYALCHVCIHDGDCCRTHGIPLHSHEFA